MSLFPANHDLLAGQVHGLGLPGPITATAPVDAGPGKPYGCPLWQGWKAVRLTLPSV